MSLTRMAVILPLMLCAPVPGQELSGVPIDSLRIIKPDKIQGYFKPKNDVVALWDPPPASNNCPSLQKCALKTEADVRTYAHLAYQADRNCSEAVRLTPTKADDEDKKIIIAVYKKKDKKDFSCDDVFPPHPLVRGALGSSLYVGRKEGAFQNAFQLLPTVALGIPLTNGEDNAATDALNNGMSPIGGVTARYSPWSFWFSFSAFVGVAAVKSEHLDPAVYTAPQMVLKGVGVDGIGGMLSLSYVWADLNAAGIFGKSRSHTSFLQVSFDLTSVALFGAGAANPSK